MTSAVSCQIGGTTVSLYDDRTVTLFSDGATVIACHEDVCHLGQAQTAQALGYPNVPSMNRAHDLTHTLLAHWLGMTYSPVLRRVALALPATKGTGLEEAAVLAIQQWTQAQGIDLVALAQERYGL